jgi:antitoxin HigA-1
LGLTQKQLAERLGIPGVRISEITCAKRAITPDTAFRLARFFDTTPDFWLGLQMDLILLDTLQNHKNEYDRIQPRQID